MKKSVPINPGEGNIYVNADKDHDKKGSIPRADFFNSVEQELLNLITTSGQTPSGQDQTQVAAAVQRIVDRGVRYQSLYQRLKIIENGLITPEDEKIIGWAEVVAETTFSFDLSLVSKTGADDIVTFELYVNQPAPVAIHWPSEINWPDNEAPDMAESGLYLFAFRQIKGMWEGSLNSKFTAIVL